MSVVSMKQLLEAGVHFGHPTRKWNPKMKKYIYTARNDIYILDLEMTVNCIDEAYAFMKEVISSGKSALFVGTKKQAKDAVVEEAKRCDMFYMGNRWLGGTLTNFKTIRGRVDRLNKLNQMEKSGEFDLLPKKEVLWHINWETWRYFIGNFAVILRKNILQQKSLYIFWRKKYPNPGFCRTAILYSMVLRGLHRYSFW